MVRIKLSLVTVQFILVAAAIAPIVALPTTQHHFSSGSESVFIIFVSDILVTDRTSYSRRSLTPPSLPDPSLVSLAQNRREERRRSRADEWTLPSASGSGSVFMNMTP